MCGINHHLLGAVVMTLIKMIQLGGPLKSARQHLALARYQPLLQLFDRR
jgi:hypothetical protein